MCSLFWIDEKRNIKKTYADLIKDLNKKTIHKKYVYFENPYEIFLEIIHSMILGKKIVLLDSDFSKEEIENLGLDLKDVYKDELVTPLNIRDQNQLLANIYEHQYSWKLTLYTSGTTGRPKKVTHTITTLTRNVRNNKKFKKNIWGFAYNPTHFAGLQVFYQALLNENMMVYLFNIDRNNIEELFIKYSITHISATPTFFRTIIPYVNRQLKSVKRVTLGGEKFDTQLKTTLNRLFPNAKVKNIYASTEAGSLFESTGELFEISDTIKTLVNISKDNELMIHKDLLGSSDDFELIGEWYYTGDLVEMIDANKFRFISRKTEMINIGGYKVNPYEVEEHIKKIDGVLDVLIKPRNNRITGNILVADIIIENNVKEKNIELILRNKLSLELQKWKIPRIIKFVSRIDKTRTGKKVRK